MTQEELERLLQALHPDPEQAARRYEEIRKKLIVKFQRLGDIDSESLADQAINRCATKLVQGIEVQNEVEGLINGIAKNVFRERYRKLVSQEILLDGYTGPTVEEPVDLGGKEEEARRKRCLRRCLARLPDEKRRLVLAYYTGEDRIAARHRLAEELALSPNALRIQAHRVRGKLEDCVDRCMDLRAVPDSAGS